MKPYDTLLGSATATPQYGLLGMVGDQHIALDLNRPQTVCVVGTQGSGKSYAAGSIVEMAVAPLGLNALPAPLAAVVFHAHRSESYAPEFVAMRQPNRGDEAHILREQYGVTPTGLTDVLVLTDEAHVVQRRAELPGVRVEPLRLAAAELDAEDWKTLMGIGKPTLYSRMINQIMRRQRGRLSLAGLCAAIEASAMTPAQQTLAATRLEFARTYLGDDRESFTQHLRPGRLIIVDVRDPLAEPDEVFALFTVLLKCMAAARRRLGGNTLAVFDEAHRYMNTNCSRTIVELCREMRHHGISLMIVSQNPLTIATELLELSTIALIHRCTSIAWLRHLQRAIAPLKAITAPQVAALAPGQALIWARDATDPAFQRRAMPLDLRPRVTHHGGHTILAVDGRAAVRRTAPLLLPPPAPALELAAPRVPSLIDSWMDAPETALLARTTRSHYATNARRWARWTAAEQQAVATWAERSAALRAYQQRLHQEHPARTVARLMTGARQFAAWLDRQDAPLQERQ